MKLPSLLCAAAVSFSMFAPSALKPAQAQAQILIKFSHVVASDTAVGKGADRFKELAERATAGKVKVEVHPNSQLYKDKDELQALQSGAVQMLVPPLSKFGPLGFKEFEVFDLPYIFPNKEVLRRVTEGTVGKQLLQKLTSKGFVGLAFWDKGFKIISANRPLIKPEDAKGQRLQIQSSKVLDAQMRALGGLPQVMAFSEVYQALQTGALDGTESPPSSMYAQNLHEVQKHATLTEHGYQGHAVLVNKKFWDSLPPDIRTALEGAMREATVYANFLAQHENNVALAQMKASGKTQFQTQSKEERAAWVKALKPVHKDAEARVGKDLIESIYKEADAAGFKM